MNKLQKWTGAEKTEPKRSTQPKSLREQREDYQRKVQEVMDARRQEEAKGKGKGKGKREERESRLAGDSGERDRRSIFIGGLSYVSNDDQEMKARMTRAIGQNLEEATNATVRKVTIFFAKRTGLVEFTGASQVLLGTTCRSTT